MFETKNDQMVTNASTVKDVTTSLYNRYRSNFHMSHSCLRRNTESSTKCVIKEVSINALMIYQTANIKPGTHFRVMKIWDLIYLEFMFKPLDILRTGYDLRVQFQMVTNNTQTIITNLQKLREDACTD